MPQGLSPRCAKQKEIGKGDNRKLIAWFDYDDKKYFIIQAIKSMCWRGFSYVKVIAVDDYSSLIRDFGTSCFRDEQSLLLPVFPDNDSTTCIRSLYFIHQWLKSQPVNIPCLAWGIMV